VNVSLATENDLAPWQTFVDNTPDAGPMHHAGWFNVLRDAYAVTPHFFMAKNDSGAIVGVMPMYRTSSIFTGTHFTTLEGGILARDEGARISLLSAAKALRNERGVRYVQIRGGSVDPEASFSLTTLHTVVPTSEGPDARWSAIKPKTRWGIRQAEKQPFEITHDTDLLFLDDFYLLYAAHMRDLGTPVFSLKTFHAMREQLGMQRLRLYLLRYEQRLVGGMLCIVQGNRWTDLYAIVRRAQTTEFANYLMYWHVIRDAAKSGIAEFDMGRSTPESNVHLFKRKWGGSDVAVQYQFYPAEGNRRSQLGLVGETREKGLAQRIWSSLPPSVCNIAGPLIRRDLPFL